MIHLTKLALIKATKQYIVTWHNGTDTSTFVIPYADGEVILLHNWFTIKDETPNVIIYSLINDNTPQKS